MSLQYTKKRSDPQEGEEELREKLIGLGERSFRKSYYPELQEKLADLERFKTLLDQSNDAIFLIEVDSGRILDVSESGCRQIEYTMDECFAMTMFDIAPDITPELNRILVGKIDSLAIDTDLRKGNGERIPYEINMRRVRFGNKDYVIAVARDITQRKKAEKELNDSRIQAELYLDLMGHDISNINQTAMGFLELANNKLQETGRLGPEDSELITIPIEKLKNSARLIENLRKIQKESSGVYKEEIIDVSRVLSDVTKLYSAVPGREIKISFRPACDCMVKANQLLKDVFANLVDNSIKHSKGPLNLYISTSAIFSDGKKLCRIAIEDNGPGIPDARKAGILDFSSAIRQRAVGKGLGLYLVKTLVDDFNGKIMVEDRIPGDYTKGSRFIILLPVVEASVERG